MLEICEQVSHKQYVSKSHISVYELISYTNVIAELRSLVL